MVHFTLPPMLRELFANVVFPKSKSDLIAYAREQGLPEDVLSGLENMPDHIYGSVDDFMLAWGFRSEFQMAEAEPAHVDPGLVAPDAANDPLAPSDGKEEGESDGGKSLAPAA